MKQFMADDFLLNSKTACTLYNDYAKDMPIYDFHCHLNPKEIYEDKKYRNITEVWLGGDHYKWRVLRELGVPEEYITGSKSDKEKFMKYAQVIPYAIGNPLYHWTHLELRRYFGITKLLNAENAEEIWNACNAKLETLTARKFITLSNVTKIHTTDDPVDSLEYHKAINADKSFGVEVLPTFRPDKSINIELGFFIPWVAKLSEVVGYKITDLQLLLKAIGERLDLFDSVGCVCSDHALDVIMYEPSTEPEANEIFKKGLSGEKLTDSEISKYKGFMLTFYGRQYHKRGWVQQYHIGALRNVSTRYFKQLGADTGFDCIEDSTFASKLARLMDSLDVTDELPKTILYCLNPRDNEVLAAVKNCFQKENTVAKIQFGSGWWFNDQKDGMTRQLEALSQFGLLSKFVGMLTDSRSFLSYTRHEYFRRILCNKLAELIENGEYPDDIAFVGKVVQDICYNNAINYFKK